MPCNIFPVFRMEDGAEPVPDDLLPFPVEIPAIGIVDKDVGAVREEAADEFGLVLNDITVPLLAFTERLLGPLALGDVPGCTDKRLYGAIRVFLGHRGDERVNDRSIRRFNGAGNSFTYPSRTIRFRNTDRSSERA